MKKYAMIAIAALTMTFAACGNQGDNKTEGNAETTAEVDKAEAKAETTYITYTNDKYGFSVDIPDWMEQKGEAIGDEGTVFSGETKDAKIILNRIDISCGKQFFDEEYTPEKVKEEFEFWSKGKEITDSVCGDDYYSFTVKGEMLTEMYCHLYKGSTYALLSISFDAAHEKQLGGEVAEHVFKSAKFN